MQRYFLKLSYLGRKYHGWQKQLNAHSIQAEIENALQILTQEPTDVLGAGRTDTGVHARQMFAHIELSSLPNNFKGRLNTILPKDIALHEIYKVRADAHARYSAISRSYEYIICRQKNVFLQDQAYFFYKKLDIDKMNAAAKMLLGEQDFSCFSKAKTQTLNNLCNITEANWNIQGDQLIFKVTANRFLRNMVRAIVGSLIEVGLGNWEVEYLLKVIASKDRSAAGFSVPAKGLYLTSVKYPDEVFI